MVYLYWHLVTVQHRSTQHTELTDINPYRVASILLAQSGMGRMA